MGEKLVIRPISKGIKTDRLAFNIDNDSFPVLQNAYQWRGRIKRKRGTTLLNRLERFFNSASTSYSNTATITLDASGNGNLLTGFSLQTNGNIIPGTVTITDTISSAIYTDPAMNGTLSPSGSINYATGAIIISASASDTIKAVFNYYPDLPVMGLEDLVLSANIFPGNLAFDTTYSYNILNTAPYNIYDVSFYKNPSTGAYPSYVQKTTVTPTSWNGQNYQQFWTTNFQGALWATNGITNPFTISNIGMHYLTSSQISSATQTSATTVNFVIPSTPLVIGDFVFANEFTGTSGSTLNFQTGYVTAINSGSNTYTVKFPEANIGNAGLVPGILQYLTNRSNTTVDCLRWYDGDPTNGNPMNPTLNGHFGWVNFAPPLSQAPYGIEDLAEAQYYLVGAVAIIPFKDRLLFIGPVVQTSTPGSQVYLQDTVIYSQNGTPYYTASFDGSVAGALTSSATTFTPILTPTGQGASAAAYIEDSTGFGGFESAGYSQPITTVSFNEDVLIIGFSNKQTRFVYTGNDVVPFNFFVINSELGSASTFSAITFDRGVATIGDHGIIITAQISSERIDLDIPDQVFQFNLTNNGIQRITAQRDFINEWIYFTYLDNEVSYIFPNQTLLYNYREQTWGIFNECYTTYGQFRMLTGNTWATLPESLTWESWNTPWNSGPSTLLQPQVIAGNQQGFVLVRENIDTNEGNSLEITNLGFQATITNATQANPCVLTANNTLIVGQQVLIENVVGMTQLNGNVYNVTAVTATTITINANSLGFTAYISGGIAINSVYSPNHCLNNKDYISINSCIGTIGSVVNREIFSVSNITNDNNNFFLIPPISASGTYVGGGLIQRMYVPFIQTKQFPMGWDAARKTRLGPQQYLISRTDFGQMELQIYLSQNSSFPYNFGPQVPDPASINNTLIYSDVLYTCPESTNLGLTPANVNLQMSTGGQQDQIWHRMNTSLLGDTVQLGFTMSDSQMRDPEFNNQFSEIELHSIIIDVTPSQVLA
jgi:hypothetical protein